MKVNIHDAGETIKNARKLLGMTQAVFGELFEKSQSEISKYEKGDISPPYNLYIHCKNIILEQGGNEEIYSVAYLKELLDERLDALEHDSARKLIREIIIYELSRSF